jgi:signal transduction histidine kinase/ActR/RegA family two-component response regulator
MGENDFSTQQHRWFRRLTTGGAVTAAGFTALLAVLGVWLKVEVLLWGAGAIATVFVLTLIALTLAAAGRLPLAARLLAGAGVAHAVVQSYLFPFAAPALAVSVVLSVASALPYVKGRPLRWLVVSSILSSLAISWLPRLSPFVGAVPQTVQQAIAMAALPAVTILTSLLLLQFTERIRFTRTAETMARLDAEQARHALEAASQRHRVAVSAAGIGIWEVDLATGKFSLDDRCEAILGLAAGPSLDYGAFLALVDENDRQYVHDSVNQIVSAENDGMYDVEYRVHRPIDAAVRWIRSTGQRLADDGAPLRLIGTARDVTADKVSETELRNARDKAEEANRAKDEFLAMLGHELRNPLAPMLTALELLRLRLGEAGAREREVIHRQVRNLSQLIDDMLDVAQIRRGRMVLETRSMYARQIVAQAYDLVAPMLEERRHRLEIDIQPPELIVVGDEQRLVQAVTNLLTNAVKYTEPGGAIRVSVTGNGEEIVLSVADTGRGIPAALLPHVFDLFVQGERTPDRREGGLGLGLAIVRSIVERHGGIVSATSSGEGTGSEFLIRVPTTGAETPLPAVLPAMETPVPSQQKVLIIDDNADAAESLCDLLGDSGFTCASAPDGPAGLNLAASFEPDAILLDLGLPGVDGYEVARRIRAMPGGQRHLIVAITGYGQDRDRRRSSEAGFDAHLVKPVELEQLLPLLQETRGVERPEKGRDPTSWKSNIADAQSQI